MCRRKVLQRVANTDSTVFMMNNKKLICLKRFLKLFRWIRIMIRFATSSGHEHCGSGSDILTQRQTW